MAGIAARRVMWVGRARTFALFVLALVVVASLGVLVAKPAHAKTFTVNSTGDDPDKSPGDGLCLIAAADQCTLRAAIEEANASAGADTINFAIPGAGPHTISPGTELPAITQPVTIDGYSESLDEGGNPARANTAPTGTNAVLKIVLDGTGVVVPPFQVEVTGLELISGSSNSVIRGLVIDNFRSRAISLTLGTGHKIEGNFLGTDPSGTAAEPNGTGVSIFAGSNSTIGGTVPEDRNLISGNVFGGIRATGGPGGNKIEGNLIGTTASGSGDLGNSGSGVNLHSASNYTVGDSDPSDGTTNAANTIAFNTGDGVFMSESQSVGNRILSNSIHSNDGLGIDLAGGIETNGVTANDGDDPNTSKLDPDKDAGPNRLQNYPDLDPILAGSTTISGHLNSTPSTRKKKRTFTIQFFSSPSEDTSHFGEGKTFLQQIKVRTNRQGIATFSFFTQPLSAGQYITATATNTKTGDTSEFSRARVVSKPGPPVGG